MCSECYKQFCPDGCPNSDTARFPVCEDCGSVLEDCLAYRGCDGKLYCIDCVEGMDADEILRLCGIDSISELLVRVSEDKTTRGKEGMVFISADI